MRGVHSLFSLLLFSFTVSANSASMHSFEVYLQTLAAKQPALSKASNLFPERVVALNWSAAEMLLTLGVEPVGLTSINGYKRWQSNHPSLPDGVAEVGSRAFPSLPLLMKLQPELIVGYPFRHARLASDLNSIAPTLLLQQFAQTDQTEYRYMDQMRLNYVSLAKTLGKQPLAELHLSAMDQELARLKGVLSQAGLANKPIVYGKFVGMGYGLRVFSQQSLAASVAKLLGLTYVWNTTLPGKDFTHLQLEEIKMLKNTALILVKEAGGKGERMMTSPLWAEHAFVKNDDIYTVDPVWSFGGPVSVIRMARAFTQALLEKQDAI